MAHENLRIIYLQAENVKRLKAVRIRPDKTLVRIEGRNGAGKSTVLDVISMCLGGEKWVADVPLRKGEAKGKCFIVLGTEDKPVLKAQRRFTAKGGNILEVFDADGNKLSSPQAVLSKLYDSDLVFDPLEFMGMTPKEQATVLRKLAGLDFEALDKERADLYEERTRVNREAKQAESFAGTPPAKPENMTPLDVRALADAQQKGIAHNRDVNDARGTVTRASDVLAQLYKDKAELQIKIERAATMELEAGTKYEALELQDVDSLGEQIAGAEEHNKAVTAYADWELRSNRAIAKANEAEALTARIVDIDDDKSRKLVEAKFPLAGLSVDANGPTFDRLPFSQAASSEQLRTSMAIGASKSSRARIMLCHHGSLLDNAALGDMERFAEEHDLQVFLERVADEASPAAVFIEDGEVIETEATP